MDAELYECTCNGSTYNTELVIMYTLV